MPHAETSEEKRKRLEQKRRAALTPAPLQQVASVLGQRQVTPPTSLAGRGGVVGVDYAQQMRDKAKKEASDKLVQEHIKRVGRGRTAPKEYTKARQGRAANIKYNDSGRQETTGPEIAKQKYGY